MERPIRTKFDIQACIPTLNNTTKNYPDPFTGSGTSHINQIDIQGSCALQTFDSHQNLYLGLYNNNFGTNTRNRARPRTYSKLWSA